MGALTPEVHGPMKIVSTGENRWGGTFTISSSDPTIMQFTGLNTKVFRTNSVVLCAPQNGPAGVMYAGRSGATSTSLATVLQVSVPTNGTLQVVHSTRPTDAIFAFCVFLGGTNLT